MSETLFENMLYATAPLVALTNPVAELPIFLSIVENRSRRGKRKAAVTVALGVLLVLLVAALGGLRILDLVGISLPAFRAAGGLLLVVMGLEMVQGRETALQRELKTSEDPEDQLWVPLVMPMLAGPGAIVTTVSLTLRETATSWLPVATIVAIVISALVVLVSLIFAAEIAAHFSRRARSIMIRFFGLVLVAIGFQMGFTGASEFFGLTPSL